MGEGYSTFVDQLDSATEKYPQLKIVSENGEKFLRGNLEIIDEEGKQWELYQVEIKFKEGFPHRFPKVFETSDKVPKIADWHIYKDESCCIDVDPSEIIKCRDGITLIGFIDHELLPYLFNQTHRRVEGYYVNSGYSHGWIGVYEFYSGKLETGNNVRKTLSLIQYIANNSRLNRSNKCFCGSNNLFRNCHMEAFDELKKLDRVTLLEHMEIIYQQSGIKNIDRFKSTYHL
ncbi:hypothetical protein [Fodinibius sp.]|uniref:hypothetical protein n=1 Tax=Fodinibius sp. TaxID=1872440 RepID=UPI002ACEBA73|nr:hypothetical protein [Fodinibius sp.]MDZ7659507.1 hypothetical protein [Fodinibius sp.]